MFPAFLQSIFSTTTTTAAALVDRTNTREMPFRIQQTLIGAMYVEGDKQGKHTKCALFLPDRRNTIVDKSRKYKHI